MSAATQPARCHAVACFTPVPQALLMCREHWSMLPDAIKAWVCATYRPGQELTQDPSREYCLAAARAICVVAWCEGREAPQHAVLAEPRLHFLAELRLHFTFEAAP